MGHLIMIEILHLATTVKKVARLSCWQLPHHYLLSASSHNIHTQAMLKKVAKLSCRHINDNADGAARWLCSQNSGEIYTVHSICA
jgi:hypothetical protein